MFSHAALNAFLNGTSGILLACGYGAIRNRRVQIHKRFMISAFAVSTVFLFSYLLYPLPRWACTVSRTRLDPPRLFRVADFAHHPGHRDRSLDSNYTSPRLAGALRQTSDHRALDAASMVLCVCYRCDLLPDGLPNLRAVKLAAITAAPPHP